MQRYLIQFFILMFSMGMGMMMPVQHAKAQQTSYIGVSYGESEVEDEEYDRILFEDTGFKLYAGYELSETLSVEIEYVDPGGNTQFAKARQEDDNGENIYIFDQNGSVSLKSELDPEIYGISAMLKLPISDIVVPFIKVGAHHFEVYTSLTIDDGSGSGSGNPMVIDRVDDETNIFFGAGINIAIHPTLVIRAEIERFESDVPTVEYISAGLMYRFQ